jgi:hypothetical protein
VAGPANKNGLHSFSAPPDVELFRDRRPVRHETEAEPEETEPVEADDITPDALREALLCSIGSIRNRARDGRAFPSDAASLEKLMDLVKDFPQLAKALEDVQLHKAQKEALAAPKPTGTTSELVKKLRIATGKS